MIITQRPVTLGAFRHDRRVLGEILLLGPTVLFLAVFFLFPVARLFLQSVVGEQGGSFTLIHYERLFQNAVYSRVLLKTFEIAVLTALSSVVVGYPVAFWLARQTTRIRDRLVLLILIPFWASFLVKAFAWIILLGRDGIINSSLAAIGLGQSQLLYSQTSVIIGMVHAMIPLTVLTMLPVMLKIDRDLMSAASTLGAPPRQVFWLVYFKLSLPGVAAAGLLVFITSLGFFIVPALLGSRRETTIAQLIIVQIQELLNWNFAAALSAVLLIATVLALWIYNMGFGLSSLTQVESGRSDHVGGSRRWRQIVNKLFLFVANAIPATNTGGTVLKCYCYVVMAFLLAPIVAVGVTGFSSSSFIEFPPPGFSLKWFREYFSSDVWLGATTRSLLIGLGTAVLATLFAGGAALAIARMTSKLRFLIVGLILAPLIVPRIVVAVGLYYFFAQVGIVGTDVALLLGHTVVAIPYSFVAILAVLARYDWNLDSAASTLGASRTRTIARVTVPINKAAIVSGMVFAFATSFDELTLALFVTGGAKTTLPRQLWDDMTLQITPTLAAVSVVMLVFITGTLLIAQTMQKRGYEGS